MDSTVQEAFGTDNKLVSIRNTTSYPKGPQHYWLYIKGKKIDTFTKDTLKKIGAMLSKLNLKEGVDYAVEPVMTNTLEAALEAFFGESKEKKSVLDGKTGVWRTAKNGQRMFIPDDGSSGGMMGTPPEFEKAAKNESFDAQPESLDEALDLFAFVLDEDSGYYEYLEYVGSNYKNQSGKSSKFWEVTYRDGKITTRWGKIGTKGQTKTQSGYKGQAMTMAMKKKQKGYLKIA